jgi:hypothetical protein
LQGALGGQIGGTSSELLQSGCITPLTQWHAQAASAGSDMVAQRWEELRGSGRVK